MARPRLSDEAKKLRGSFEPSRGAGRLFHGRAALTEPLAPPSDLDAAAQREWRAHMLQCVAARTISHVNLCAFRALVETAAARNRAYRLAMRQGPIQPTANGGTKTNAAWLAFLAADACYLRWAQMFGLTPKAGAGLPQLPVAGESRLQAVG
jgi:phage terminase small subunit